MDNAPTSSSPATNAIPIAQPVNMTLGFLSILNDATGVLGGYLVTNAWGRPLEFRLSTAVQPNRVQQILYGPTLTSYLHADLIGKTLIEKCSVPPTLLVTDSLHALELRTRLNLPTVAIGPASVPAELRVLQHDRSSTPLVYMADPPGELERLLEWLDRVDSAVDLAEPFARIREAVAEARKLGASHRAA